MSPLAILGVVGVFLAGLLAGIELVVRYGVQPALTALDDRAHLAARQSLVRRLRILVPAVMVPTVLVAVAVLVFGVVAGASAESAAVSAAASSAPAGLALTFRIATVAALAAFLGFAFLGTVPINIQVDAWNPDAPPADWKDVVRRWQRIDVFRSSAAILAFAFALLALALA